MPSKIFGCLKSIWKFTFRVKQFDNGFSLPVPAAAMWISAIWPYNFTWITCMISVLSTSFVVFGEISAMIHYWPDVAAECNIGSTLITGSRSIYISLLIGYRVKKFVAMLDIFIEKVWVSERENKLAHRIAERGIIISNWGNLAMIGALTFYLIIPLIQANEPGNKPFPYLIVYPFDTQSLLPYSLIYINCFIAGIVGVGSVTGHDTLMNYMLLHTCVRLRMLSSRIQVIGERFTDSKIKHDSHIAEELKSVTEAHCDLISFTNRMEELFNPHILMHFFGTSILTCILGVQLLLVQLTIVERAKIILYFTTCLGQLYVSCANGEKLIENSSHIAEAVYNFRWPDVSTKYRADILIIMQRAQRPLKLTAGKFFDLSMETFSSTLKTAASYFALLKNLLEEHN